MRQTQNARKLMVLWVLKFFGYLLLSLVVGTVGTFFYISVLAPNIIPILFGVGVALGALIICILYSWASEEDLPVDNIDHWYWDTYVEQLEFIFEEEEVGE